jgi:hypothetical protein
MDLETSPDCLQIHGQFPAQVEGKSRAGGIAEELLATTWGRRVIVAYEVSRSARCCSFKVRVGLADVEGVEGGIQEGKAG